MSAEAIAIIVFLLLVSAYMFIALVITTNKLIDAQSNAEHLDNLLKEAEKNLKQLQKFIRSIKITNKKAAL